jgi:8-amino-7-oxononanoate synthase
MSVFERWRVQLEQLRQEGRHRILQPPAGIDFSSNDYLGYSKIATTSAVELARSGTASRLLRGQQPIWDKVEARLAAWHGAEAALMLTSGYAANEGLLSTVVAPSDLVFSDQFNHASIIDGIKLSRAEKIIYRHNDLDELSMRLQERRARRGAQQAWFIVTESLFGMEGDVAPLRELAELAQANDAHLIVDEAHATGCFGAHGSGLIDALGLRQRVLATVHTGGKALAVTGGYIVGTRLLKELLINRCRQLIFTTALPPQIGTWWLQTLDRVYDDASARAALHDRAGELRRELSARDITAGGTHYIVSIVLGTDETALAAARVLQEAGFDVRAIRPPTVPLNTARLRISIHADHSPNLIRELVGAIA